MDLVGIGDAARVLGLNASALRYYEQRGLVEPVTRHRGRRMYDVTRLRRLALVQIMQQLGVSLDTAGALLHEPSGLWRRHLHEQIAQLEDLITRATVARELLAHAVDCPAEHPVDECPHLIGLLDQRLAGASVEQLSAEHTGTPLR
jgi:MerR family transcriptional regulator, copper efflux regulator